MNSAATGLGRASPLEIATRSDPARSTSATSRNAGTSDGTKCSMVTASSRTRRTIAVASRRAGSGVMTSRAPLISGNNCSHTETSKLNEVLCRTTSSGPTSYRSRIHNRRLTRPRWFTATPLGRPVDPDV